MAVMRDRPYCQFNFLVDLGDGVTDGPRAGFQEMSAISTEVAVTEYRNGNSKENSPIKITGLNKATDVTMKRGIIGALDLYAWLERHPQRQPERAAHRHDPAAERGPQRGRADLEAAARAHHQAQQRAVQRQGQRRRHGGARPRLRAARDGVARWPSSATGRTATRTSSSSSAAAPRARAGPASPRSSSRRSRSPSPRRWPAPRAGPSRLPAPTAAATARERSGRPAAPPAPRRHRRARPLRLVGPGAPRQGAAAAGDEREAARRGPRDRRLDLALQQRPAGEPVVLAAARRRRRSYPDGDDRARS